MVTKPLWLMHTEFNSVCISHLRFRFRWSHDTTIGTTSPQDRIAARFEMEVQCAWVAGKTCVRRTTVGVRTDACYYVVKYSHTGLEQVSGRILRFINSSISYRFHRGVHHGRRVVVWLCCWLMATCLCSAFVVLQGAPFLISLGRII